MGLFKRGRTWWISFSHNGQQVRRSTETDDRKLAEMIFRKVMTQVAEGKWLDKAPGEDKTFNDLMDKYMVAHSKPEKASWDRDERSLIHLRPYFGSYRISEIMPDHISEYKILRRQEHASPCTINRELALMKHAYTMAIREWRWARENPVKMVRMEKEPPPRDRWLTYEDEKALLTVSPAWLRELISFAVETGCRKDEMLSLLWRDVDLVKRVATVFGKKTGDRRTIPLSDVAYRILLSKHNVRQTVQSLKESFVFCYPPGQKVSVHTLRTAFEHALKIAGIEGFRFHDLRHTFATRLSQSGVDPYMVQTLMGHKSFATTKRYSHHCVESLRRGIDAADRARAEQEAVITILSQSRV